MSGEEAHAKGADGARRAKLYLEGTSRAMVPWVNPDPIAVPKLTFPWIDDSSPFSFDLGGTLLGEGLAGQEFLAECKMYKAALDQLQHYTKFLAQCYRALTLRPERCDNFLWITWAAFGSTVWDDLTKLDRVVGAVQQYAHKAAIDGQIDNDLCKAVAERVRILVLSEWHEALIPTREHLGVIRKYDTEKGAH